MFQELFWLLFDYRFYWLSSFCLRLVYNK